MSGAISIGAALAATAIAATTVAEVGLTVGATFAIIGAVGATVSAVGAVTKVKELQYAGMAIGAVGMVGGLASAAGLFGAAGELGGAVGEAGGFGSWLSGAGDAAASGGATLATDAGTWAGAAAPTAGYAGVGELMAGQGITAGEIPAGMDAIDMANGIPQVNTGAVNVSTAASPNVAPDMGTFGEGNPGAVSELPGFKSPTEGFDLTSKLPDYQSPTEGFDLAPPRADAGVPDMSKSLLNQTPADINGKFSPMPAETNMTPIETDAAGRIIPQGDGEGAPGSLGAGARNPAAPAEFDPLPTSAPVTGSTATQPVAPTPSPTVAATDPASMVGSGTQAASAGAEPPQFVGGVGNTAGQAKAGPSAWSSIADFVQKNQTLSYGAIQAVGSFISGALKPNTDQAMLNELATRQQQNIAAANLYDAQASLLQRRMNNMTNLPVAYRQPRGLINSGVTGQV